MGTGGREDPDEASTIDLEVRLMGLGKGVGPVTANIFLREMRSVWPKADPALSPLALLAARDFGLAKGIGNPLDALRICPMRGICPRLRPA